MSPTKTGVSHALGTLLATIASGLLLAYYKRHLDELVGILEEVSVWLITTFELPMTTDIMTMILVASLLSAVWGVGYHSVRYGG